MHSRKEVRTAGSSRDRSSYGPRSTRGLYNLGRSRYADKRRMYPSRKNPLV